MLAAQGRTVPTFTRQLGWIEQTYFRWCKEYGGLKIDQAKRLKDLEQGNYRPSAPETILPRTLPHILSVAA